MLDALRSILRVLCWWLMKFLSTTSINKPINKSCGVYLKKNSIKIMVLVKLIGRKMMHADDAKVFIFSKKSVGSRLGFKVGRAQTRTNYFFAY